MNGTTLNIFSNKKEEDKIRIHPGVTTFLGLVVENVTFSSVKPLISTPNLLLVQ